MPIIKHAIEVVPNKDALASASIETLEKLIRLTLEPMNNPAIYAKYKRGLKAKTKAAGQDPRRVTDAVADLTLIRLRERLKEELSSR